MDPGAEQRRSYLTMRLSRHCQAYGIHFADERLPARDRVNAIRRGYFMGPLRINVANGNEAVVEFLRQLGVQACVLAAEMTYSGCCGAKHK